MKHNSDNIEERLVPFVEGVLNEREEREVRAAAQADPELAREIAELREVIGELRTGFAAGLRPPQTELTPEEVVELANHNGKPETMPGSSEMKTRLFASDQALEEYRLLMALRDEGLEATMDMSDVPPMPESLRQEFLKLKDSASPKLQALPTHPGFWKRSIGYLDKINPRPLMAAAAAFALISLGVHFAGQPQGASSAPSGDSRVAMADNKTMGLEQAPMAADGSLGQAAGTGAAHAQPSGVTVFTSSDKNLLREQAEKLLSSDIRYTVTDNRILVSEKELPAARKVLWGEDLDQKVAMAGETEQARTVEGSGAKSKGKRRDKLELGDIPTYSSTNGLLDHDKESPPPPLKIIDLSDKKHGSGVEYKDDADNKPAPSAATTAAPKRQAAEPAAPPAPASLPTSKPQVAGAGLKPAPAPAAIKNETPDERLARLRRLALGQTQPTSVPKDSASTAATTRGSTAPALPESTKQAPVANAVSADNVGTRSSRPEGVLQQDGGAVASQTEMDSAPRPSKVDLDNIEVAQEEAAPSSSADEGYAASEQANRPAAAVKTARNTNASAGGGLPVPSVASAVTKPAVVSVEKKPDATPARLAAIRDAQPAVARKYNVVLSIEQRGSQINVYVRPKGELSKDQIDELRRAIRSELGLAAADSIIFQ